MTNSSPAERLTRIQVSAFRGVPDTLEVVLAGGRSLAVCGDNGTGKSTLADALEWFFTGKIGFLAHEGRGHAVRHQGATGPTWVEVETTGALGGRATHPHDGKSAACAVGETEMFQLRGRALVEFIDKTKGEKWKELANILGFEAANQLSLDLQRVRNDLEAARLAADAGLGTAAAALVRQSIDADEASILAYVGQQCAVIGVLAPSTFKAAIDPNWAPSLTQDRDAAMRAGRRAALAAEVAALATPDFDRGLLSGWNDVIAIETSEDRARRVLIGAADKYLASASALTACPVCGQSIDFAKLRQRVTQTLADLKTADSRFRLAEEGMMALVATAKAAEALRTECANRARQLGAGTLGKLPAALSGELERAQSNRTALAPTVLGQFVRELAAWDMAAAKATKADLELGGDDRGRALAKIVIGAELSRQWVIRRATAEAASRAHDVAQRIFDSYQDRLRSYFGEVLQAITARTSEIWARLHPDEGLEDVRIEPWEEKGVELVVHFHGTDQRPPHGVLSESHLNSLAIALFLAMAERFNDRLGFLVLDDVINSFDREHRGRLAELLVSEFKTRQLVVLTHDPLFYRRLTTLAPDWNRLEFTSWSFDAGPRTLGYAGSARLGAAQARLAAGDRHDAATKGRLALEEMLQEVCERFEADLPFRRGSRNDQREYGEVVAGARGMLKKRAPRLKEQLEPLFKLLDADVRAALNVESHASQEQASDREIGDALARVEQLEQAFTCANCGTRVWTIGTPASCRCECGGMVFPPNPPAPPAAVL